jgi:cytoskeleton protein RodZ
LSETDEIAAEPPSVGDRLRAAREEKKLNLEDVAEQTRIPRRHLEAIEAGDWDRLPAPTYTIGFAKSFASAVGLDRNEIGEQVRDEIGTPRQPAAAEVFEPVDPARTMPRWLVLGAIGAIVLVVLVMSWLNSRALEPDEAPAPAATATETAGPAQTAAAPPQAQQAAQGPVVVTATAQAWIRVTDGGRTLFEGMLEPGQRYQVPATATAPLLRAGAPEALRITVGNQVAPPVGPAGQVTSNVSLLGPDLLGG